jgi:hypothetical protein
MLYVKITKEELIILGSRKTGITSGKKDKKTGKRELIYFCSNLDFIGLCLEREKEFIKI